MSRRLRLSTILALALAHAALATPRGLPVYSQIAGSDREYVVVAGDSLWAISGRFTMTNQLLEALNPLDDRNHLHVGQRLRVSDRHVVPRRDAEGIVIDVAARTLFWFRKGALEARFPVAVGRADWATPPGRYRIIGRREDPVWHVPPSIQEEMRRRGEPVVTSVGAGPDNPLGKYWIQLSAAGYGIHGTNAPMSVGKVATHGCMRLLPEHVERLFHEAPDGLRVDVVDEPIKVARDADGRIWLEVHPDLYRDRPLQAAEVVSRIVATGLGDVVDAAAVAGVVGRAWGTPEEVTRGHAHAEATPDGAVADAEAVSRSAAGP